MERTSFAEMSCSMAQTLAVIGERWTPLILRDIYLGISRFDAMHSDLGISRKVLAERISFLVDEGVIKREAYQQNPPRYDYWLTEKGADLALVALAMKAWGDRWAPGEGGERMLLRHETCGEIVEPVTVCSGCGEPLAVHEITPLLGPGFEPGPGTSGLPEALERLLEIREGAAAS
jgi:DNA-binding HxlR family transcriptional regulator